MTLRDLPSVEKLMTSPTASRLTEDYGRSLVLQAIREQLEATRSAMKEGSSMPEEIELIEQAHERVVTWLTQTLRPVINATGVILHTNLGRAPLSRDAREAMRHIAEGYSTLEYNLSRGIRGNREVHVEELLTRLSGAEAGFVVNNNAAGVLLALTVLSRRKEVLISRSQLIEIGGGFRVPDVMKQSGAKLIEVGTTNRTHLKDFEEVIHERTGLILRAHHSNFKIIGFTTEPSLADLVELGHKYDVPVLDDLGSGALLDTSIYGLGHEPTVQESLQTGADLVAFSGDKLLGGPQAGILVGDASIIKRLRKSPLARAVRADKLCLAALSATLIHYLKDEAESKIPVWRMISARVEDLNQRAEGWRTSTGQGDVIDGRSPVGGGSLPEETLPTKLFSLSVPKPNAFADRLRSADPPVIARVEDDRVLLDPRTVLDEQDPDMLSALRTSL